MSQRERKAPRRKRSSSTESWKTVGGNFWMFARLEASAPILRATLHRVPRRQDKRPSRRFGPDRRQRADGQWTHFLMLHQVTLTSWGRLFFFSAVLFETMIPGRSERLKTVRPALPRSLSNINVSLAGVCTLKDFDIAMVSALKLPRTRRAPRVRAE